MKKKISIKLKNSPSPSPSSKPHQPHPNSHPNSHVEAFDQNAYLLKKINRRFLKPTLNLIENEGLDENGNCLLTLDGLYIIKEVLNHIVDLNSTSNIEGILTSFVEEEEVEVEVEEVFEELENYEEDDDENDKNENKQEIRSSNDYDVEELDELDELDNYVVDSDDDFYEE